MSTKKLRIACCGGGITSLCLAHALAKHEHLDVKIFEKSPKIHGEGAAVGLQPNAQKAMAEISSELRAAIDDAGGVSMDPMLRVMIATGPNAGKHAGDARTDSTQIVVYWGALYRALLERIPEDSLKLGKGFTSVTVLNNGALQVNFEDGTSCEADAIVGCDGINSIVRKTVLGASHPAVEAIYSDRYGHRVVVPMEQARATFGDEYCSVATQHGWCGDNLYLLTDHANNGESMQVIADFGMEDAWPSKKPFIEWPKEKMQKNLARCGAFGQAMAKVFSSQPQLYAARMRVHPPTPTYCNGRVCIAGDAAMAFLPFHGAGAGQAIEDALILSTVLGACSDPEDIGRAFKIYDAIRRPRRARVAEVSELAGYLLTGRDPEVGLDPDRLAGKVLYWGPEIWDYDQAAAKQDALDQMRQ